MGLMRPDIVTFPEGRRTNAASVELVAVSAQYTGSVHVVAAATGDVSGVVPESGSPQAATRRMTAITHARIGNVFNGGLALVTAASARRARSDRR